MEKWNKLCRALSEEIPNDLTEAPFEKEIIFALDSVLGWDRFYNVKSQVPVKMGISTRFIDVVVHDGDDNDLFVIEAKRPNLLLKGHDEQLKSYMMQKRLNVGILIGNKIKIYFDNGNETILIEEIEFKRNTLEGLNFTKNFHKENYSEDNIKKYIKEQLNKKEEIKIAKKLKSKLLSKSYNDRIISFLKEEFEEGYSENVIEKVFENLKIKIEDITTTEDITTKVDSVYVKKNREEGIGINAYVKDSFKYLDKNLLNDSELINLQDLDYSTNIFKINHPFLIKLASLTEDKSKRYWKDDFIINNEIYRACSQWSSNSFNKKENKTLGEIKKEKFDNWLKKIKKEL
tara:strand:- start:1582 stop:2619 length:1038 start_codon:yes stop_codon:yes gene_type:complete